MNMHLKTALFIGILAANMLDEFAPKEQRQDKPKSIHKKRSHKAMNRNKKRSRT